MKTKNDLMYKFGKKVASIRVSHSMTQEQLAEAATISLDFLSLIERGLRGPSFPTMERLAGALGVEVKDLFNFDQ